MTRLDRPPTPNRFCAVCGSPCNLTPVWVRDDAARLVGPSGPVVYLIDLCPEHVHGLRRCETCSAGHLSAASDLWSCRRSPAAVAGCLWCRDGWEQTRPFTMGQLRAAWESAASPQDEEVL